MRKLFSTVAALAVASCTAAPPPQQAAAVPGARSCLSLDQVSGRYTAPPNSVIFETVGPVIYRNDLASRCPGIERLGASAAIAFDTGPGGQVCRGDRIRIFDPIESRATGIASNPACVLGDFIPIARPAR